MTPALTYDALALPFSPPSSAGQPKTTTLPPALSATCFNAEPAKTLDVPIML